MSQAYEIARQLDGIAANLITEGRELRANAIQGAANYLRALDDEYNTLLIDIAALNTPNAEDHFQQRLNNINKTLRIASYDLSSERYTLDHNAFKRLIEYSQLNKD